MSLLEGINNCNDIKKLTVNQLNSLAEEVRSYIISVTKENGGHLASSLGAVDVIIAVLYVFDFPKDKIIFDVGHQAYAYKILTDRKKQFKNLRQSQGISGFPHIFESVFDSFSSGHAGDCLSASLGYATARDMQNQDYFVISLIGDGAFCNGETLEALFSSCKKPEKFLAILNDNGMAISKNQNGFTGCVNEKSDDNNFDLLKSINLKQFGFNYKGNVNGHDIGELINVLQNFYSNPIPTFLHIKTTKGKGLTHAENDAEFYHSVSKDYAIQVNDFSASLGEFLCSKIEQNKKIITIVAGMSYGTGTSLVKKNYPNNFIDVGICEDHAVTLASGLSLGGMRPIVCIYSTFLQRAYDQIVENVCLQNLPVIFLIDRAGVVGGDGYTHQGIFDLSYLSHIPNLTVFTPKNCDELKLMIDYALTKNSPFAIRYPNGVCNCLAKADYISDDNLWEVLKEGEGRYCVLATGSRSVFLALKACENLNCTVINVRSVKPLDVKMLQKYFDRDFITIEDNVITGGFGSLLSLYLTQNNYKGILKIFALKDKFIGQGSVKEQLELSDISVKKLKNYILNNK